MCVHACVYVCVCMPVCMRVYVCVHACVYACVPASCEPDMLVPGAMRAEVMSEMSCCVLPPSIELLLTSTHDVPIYVCVCVCVCRI